MKARVGPIYGSGGFLSDVFFFSGRWAFNCGAYKWEGGLYWGRRGGLLSDEFFYPSRWAYNFGLISGRGAYWRGGGVGLLSHVLFSR